MPFDLHPEYPPEGVLREEFHARHGGRLRGHAEAMFEQAGIVHNPPEVIPNTMLAQRVTELARDRGLQSPVHDRLMDAYWVESRNIGDPEELRAIVVETGLDAAEVDDVLAGDAFRDRVLGSTAEAHSIGVNGVPAWLLDRRLLIMGAQPRQVFEAAFAQLAGEETV